MDNHVVPECYIDTMLLKVLVPPKKRWNHQHGCYNVSRELETGGLKDKFAIGIVDNDKKQVNYLEQFTEIDREVDSNDIGVILLKNSHQYFIRICPAIEKFIIQICEDEQISLEDYDIPNKIDELKKITKSQNSEHDPRFIRLFQHLRKSDNRKLGKYRRWIEMLVDKNYQVDINELING